MLPSDNSAESILTIDIGSIHTRALLFDVVDGQYRFIAANRAASTALAPMYDISDGILQAILGLQEITTRVFIQDEHLVIPSRTDGSGIDQLFITFSAGPSLNMVIIGLLEEISLESAQRLVHSVQGIAVEAIGINDRRKTEEQIDAILRANPDVIILTGGTNGGATRSIAKMTDLVGMALQVLPRDERPEVIFAGNQNVANSVSEALNKICDVQITPNIRPSIECEDLNPAIELTTQVIHHIRSRQLGGLQSFAKVTAAEPSLTSQAFGRIINFLSGVNSPGKTAVGVDLGAAHTDIATARQTKLRLSSIPFGMGSGMANVLNHIPLSDITRWLSMDIPETDVQDYLWQKTLYPGSIPASVETLAIEQAVAREILRSAMDQHTSAYDSPANSYEPVVASGMAITQISPAQSLLMLLDGLQPWGVTSLILDPYGIVSALGAAAPINSMLPVHVLESNALVNLGTVISPVCNARFGTPILKVRVEYEAGKEVSQEIKQGGIFMLPIQPGQSARIHLQPLRPLIIDPNRKESYRNFKITGGVCGAIIDTRGRPFNLSTDPARNRDLNQKWLRALSAQTYL